MGLEWSCRNRVQGYSGVLREANCNRKRDLVEACLGRNVVDFDVRAHIGMWGCGVLDVLSGRKYQIKVAMIAYRMRI